MPSRYFVQWIPTSRVIRAAGLHAGGGSATAPLKLSFRQSKTKDGGSRCLTPNYGVWPPLDAAPRRLPSTVTAAVFTLLLPSFARLPLNETIMPSFIVETVQPVR